MTSPALPDTGQLHRALEAAVIETLSVMFFADVNEVNHCECTAHSGTEHAGDAPRQDSPLCVEVGFRGARAGWLAIRADACFAAFCEQSFEGLDQDEAPGQERVRDTVREMGNIICGSLLSSLWPGHLFQVDEPRVVARLRTSASHTRAGLRIETLDGGLCTEFAIAPERNQDA